jgi:hypothetical protein
MAKMRTALFFVDCILVESQEKKKMTINTNYLLPNLKRTEKAFRRILRRNSKIELKTENEKIFSRSALCFLSQRLSSVLNQFIQYIQTYFKFVIILCYNISYLLNLLARGAQYDVKRIRQTIIHFFFLFVCLLI